MTTMANDANAIHENTRNITNTKLFVLFRVISGIDLSLAK